MNELVLISFVLAIYNVEDYLKECIESIVCETGNYEVLLIDDGSTDASGAICDDFEARYKSIKAFHKKNGGLSDARNYGMSKAVGKYIFFVDSDDFLPLGSVKQLLNIAGKKESDVIVWNSYVVGENKQIIEYCNGKYNHPALKESREYLPKEFIEMQIDLEKDFPRTVWLGMYKRAFLISECLWFEKGLLHEDELWTPKTYIKASSIYYLNEEMYCYRIRQDSIMNKVGKDYSRNLQSIIYIYNSLPFWYDYMVKDSRLNRYLKGDIAKRYLSALAKYNVYRYPKLVDKISKFNLLKNAVGLLNKVRTLILITNIKLYCVMSNRFKKINIERK